MKAGNEFTLRIEGRLDTEETINALFEAGCDDASFSMVDDAGFGTFHRRASSLSVAIESAIRDVESVAGLRVLGVDTDDLVTMADIARRLGRTRESVRLLVSGKRGKGDFPEPLARLGSRSPFWRWADVAEWAGKLPPQEQARAHLIAAVNAALEFRRQRAGLDPWERALIDTLAS